MIRAIMPYAAPILVWFALCASTGDASTKAPTQPAHTVSAP